MRSLAMTSTAAFAIAALGSRNPAHGNPMPGEADETRGEVVDSDGAVPAHGPRLRSPAIADVLAAAYRAAGLDRDPTRGWVRRARIAGLVPWVTVRTGRNTNWHDNDVVVDHGMALEVRATWRLDRLVFDGRELQVAAVEAARRRERRQLANRVIGLYFGWRRSQGLAAVDEAAAELDALTDGWFSEVLRERRRR